MTKNILKGESVYILGICNNFTRPSKIKYKVFYSKDGKCSTFNSKNTSFIENNELDTTLQLKLDAQPEEYYDPWNDCIGFRVYLHEPGEPHQSIQGGILISPGFSYYATITREKVG